MLVYTGLQEEIKKVMDEHGRLLNEKLDVEKARKKTCRFCSSGKNIMAKGMCQTCYNRNYNLKYVRPFKNIPIRG